MYVIVDHENYISSTEFCKALTQSLLSDSLFVRLIRSAAQRHLQQERVGMGLLFATLAETQI